MLKINLFGMSKSFTLEKEYQSGRSMVEMLGVLAVIGVLSLGGITGYKALSKKHKSNETIAEVLNRAISASQQIALVGDSLSSSEIASLAAEDNGEVKPDSFLDAKKHLKDITLNNFPQDTPYGKFSPKVKRLDQDFFSLSVSGLEKEECSQMKLASAKSVRDVLCLKNTDETYTAEFVFQNNLSETTGNLNAEVISESTSSRSYNNDEKGCQKQGYKYCPNGTCVEMNDVCPDKAYSCDNLLCDSGYFKNGCDCLPCRTGVKKCTDDSFATSCLEGYYLENNVCHPCPENAYSCGDDGFYCRETYYKKDGECVSCLTNIVERYQKLKQTASEDFIDEIDLCNTTCFTGRYAVYNSTNNPQNMTVTCKNIPAPQSLNSISDSFLENNWKYRGGSASGFNWGNMKVIFGDNPTGAQIRSKLNEILGDNYIIPPVFSSVAGTWYSVQSWCRANGGSLISYNDYFSNNQELGMATYVIQGGYSTGNYGVFWASPMVSGSIYCGPGGRSTRWQCKGAHSTDNSLYFLCKKN